MSVRVHELAKRCGLSNKEMIEKLRAINYPVKSHSSTVDNITAEAIQQEHGYVPPAPEPEPAPAAAAEQTAPSQADSAPTATAVVEPPPAPAAPPQPAPAAPTAPAAPIPSQPPPRPARRLSDRPAQPLAEPPKQKPAAPATPTPVAPPKPTVRRPLPPPPPRPAPVAIGEPQFTLDEQGRKVIQMKPPVVVRDLAQRLGMKPHMLLMELMEMNVFASISETLGEDAARKLCERHGFVFSLEKRERGAGTALPIAKPTPELEAGDRPQDLQPRPPIVTVMGHVDHGKTSLLDAIRRTKVAAGESGGITQHIGASVVEVAGGRKITFLDTPGHEAFTKMRARGANLTDIAVLVVAADDGVMPQTIEALNHAKAANVAIIVAVNKSDLPAANPDRVKKQLQEHGVVPEAWGGDVITVETSATTGQGIDTLLEMILLQADMLELKASPKRAAKGNVIESQIEPGMGPTATVLVRKGTLQIGDAILCGPHGGKVRALIDDKGKRVKQVTPGLPAKIVGLSGLPEAGAEFVVLKTEKEARELSAERHAAHRAHAAAPARQVGLEQLLGQMQESDVKRLALILKTDVQGSLEAIHESLGKLKSDKVEIAIIHTAVGNINENDVLLASASDAVIIGFRVKTESGVTDVAKREGVPIRLYSVIYELIEQVQQAMEGMLEPESREQVVGHAEVRQVFDLSKGGRVAGCVVTDGRIARNARVRLLRRRAVQYEGRIASLRHFQDDVKEVRAGMECGLRLDNFSGFQEGDTLECYTVEQVASKL
jgi:translation initiation factor IF-2